MWCLLIRLHMYIYINHKQYPKCLVPSIAHRWLLARTHPRSCCWSSIAPVVWCMCVGEVDISCWTCKAVGWIDGRREYREKERNKGRNRIKRNVLDEECTEERCKLTIGVYRSWWCISCRRVTKWLTGSSGMSRPLADEVMMIQGLHSAYMGGW